MSTGNLCRECWIGSEKTLPYRDSLAGWIPRNDGSGFFFHPDYSGWLRNADGKWFSVLQEEWDPDGHPSEDYPVCCENYPNATRTWTCRIHEPEDEEALRAEIRRLITEERRNG